MLRTCNIFSQITDSGELVIPSLTSRHRRSYETLFIARLRCACIQCSPNMSRATSTEISFTESCVTRAVESTLAMDCSSFHPRSFANFDIPTPPTRQVICAVPPRQHSRKPNLAAVFAAFLPPCAHSSVTDENSSNLATSRSNCLPPCLELFARNLTPHWTSWGNEVILHQHTEFFEPKHR